METGDTSTCRTDVRECGSRMGRDITIQWNDMTSELFAKVVFDQYMTEFSKSCLKSDWNQFKRRVDKAINLVEIPEEKQ